MRTKQSGNSMPSQASAEIVLGSTEDIPEKASRQGKDASLSLSLEDVASIEVGGAPASSPSTKENLADIETNQTMQRLLAEQQRMMERLEQQQKDLEGARNRILELEGQAARDSTLTAGLQDRTTEAEKQPAAEEKQGDLEGTRNRILELEENAVHTTTPTSGSRDQNRFVENQPVAEQQQKDLEVAQNRTLELEGELARNQTPTEGSSNQSGATKSPPPTLEILCPTGDPQPAKSQHSEAVHWPSEMGFRNRKAEYKEESPPEPRWVPYSPKDFPIQPMAIQLDEEALTVLQEFIASRPKPHKINCVRAQRLLESAAGLDEAGRTDVHRAILERRLGDAGLLVMYHVSSMVTERQALYQSGLTHNESNYHIRMNPVKLFQADPRPESLLRVLGECADHLEFSS